MSGIVKSVAHTRKQTRFNRFAILSHVTVSAEQEFVAFQEKPNRVQPTIQASNAPVGGVLGSTGAFLACPVIRSTVDTSCALTLVGVAPQHDTHTGGLIWAH